MLISEFVETKWNAKNKKRYMDLGYIFTKMGDPVQIKVEDIADNSSAFLLFKCDYCGEYFEKKISYYNRNLKRNNIILKDCCDNCISEKRKESNLKQFGFEVPLQRAEVREKLKNTMVERYGVENFSQFVDFNEIYKRICQEKYGVDNIFQLEDIKEKTKNTCLDKYGVEYYSQSKDFKIKYKDTCLEKYGVEHIMQVDEFKEKAKQTMLDNYGVEHALCNDEILNNMKEKVFLDYGVDNISQLDSVKLKKSKTFYENQSVATSRQQRYLHKLLGGIINYSNNTPNLDIAFPDNKIYIEFNGSGHDLCVKTNQMTQKEFDDKERRRYYYLKSLGWKGIFIESPRDYLPSDEILIYEFNKALKWFNSNEIGHCHYNMIIGEKAKDQKYGKLRKIKDTDLKEAS